MDWIAVGALAELVGAVAVVLTLLYLAEQVRNNTRMARRAATAEAVAAIREANARIPDDLSVSQLFWKGLQGLENLSEDERGQFGIITFNLFKACEHLHYQWVVGAMDPDVWTGWEWKMRVYLTAAGSRQWYEERRQAFSSKFREWLDNAVPDTTVRLTPEIGEPPHKRCVSTMRATRPD